MNPPTKFSKMRANRVKGARRAFDDAIRAHIAAESPAQVVAKIGAGEYRIEFPPEPPAAPAVPTMEIDGARYKEAPEREAGMCAGCEFKRNARLCDACKLPAAAAFGDGDCNARRVIYIRAD